MVVDPKVLQHKSESHLITFFIIMLKHASAATISKRSNRPAPTMTGTPKATLLLLSLHGAFQTKALELFEGIHVKIGRQTSAKSAPSPNNGFFDSKVLSRTHAEVWCERSKIYIRDVKSSNGTFINGIRLSPEGEESASVELHNGDQVEFGIDIMNEDGSGKQHEDGELSLYRRYLIHDLNAFFFLA